MGIDRRRFVVLGARDTETDADVSRYACAADDVEQEAGALP